MGQYYYAVTSLPQLFLDSEQFPSLNEFMTLCRENLSRRDLRIIEYSVTKDAHRRGKRSAIALLDEWNLWNESLRADLAVARAQALGMDTEEYSDIERVLGTVDTARDILAQENALVSEEALEATRWVLLDELEVGHYFDVHKLIIYMNRIMILERKSAFQQEKGRENFERIYSAVTEESVGDNPE